MPGKLLIVDDENSMRRLYSRMFKNANYSLTLAGSLAEARGLMSANTYDLLITDLQLGDGSGMELVRQANDTGATRTIIISGAFALDDLRSMAMQYGVPAFFCKPFPTDGLLDTVARLLRER